MANWALALHGGAGPLRNADYRREEAFLAALLQEGAKALAAGEAGLEVAVRLVAALEDCGHHIAGKGAAANADGDYELDAAVMDGFSRRAGAVAGLRGFLSPIDVARRVMTHTPHVLLVGRGAEAFAAKEGCAAVADPASYYQPIITRPVAPGELAHGTVGAVVLDSAGHLTAATSTGGLLNKMPGRVGDTPIIGAGLWADRRVAVCCTGQGELFLRANVAADVSARMAYGGQSVHAAAAAALADMAALGGDGGLIAIDAAGHITMPFVSEGMKRGAICADGRFEVKTAR